MRYCRWNCPCEILVGHGMIFINGMVEHFKFFVCIPVSQRNGCLHTFYVDCVLVLVVTAENDKCCRCGICEVAEDHPKD